SGLAMCLGAFMAVLAVPSPVRAADQTWTNSVPGSNYSWSQGVGNWTPYIWDNFYADSAFFTNSSASVVGTIMVGTPITAKGMSFTVNGYTIAGSNSITLSTSSDSSSLGVGEIQVSSSVSATINAPLSGSVGLTKTGAA